MVVNGNGADMSGEAKARQADALMKDWLEDPDTPKWAHGLIQSMTPTDGALMSTRDLFHIGKDIELCLMIAWGDPETQERWAGNTDCPDWFREAMWPTASLKRSWRPTASSQTWTSSSGRSRPWYAGAGASRRRASRHFRHDDRMRAVNPDAFGVLRKGGTEWAFFLEWERRAVRPSTMSDRLAPYLRYYTCATTHLTGP